MTKRIAAIVVVAAFGMGGAALAGGEGEHKSHTKKTEGAQSGQMEGAQNKELAVIDVYLDTAGDNAQLIEFLAGLPAEEQDRAIISEVQTNLNKALEGAIKHAGRIKAAGDASNKELVSKLKDARTAARKLRGVKMDQLSTSTTNVSGAIQDAQSSFDTIAQNAGYTKMEEGQRQPVRGGTPERDIKSKPDESDRDKSDKDKEEMPPPPGTEPETLPEPAQPTAPPTETNPPGY